MCGIIAYIGEKEAFPIIIDGLRRLEYRGYDSAGIALLNDNLQIFKRKGRVKDLEELVRNDTSPASMGIGHTRWATHGKPDDINAHPHVSGNGELVIVHNGIIENYDLLKGALQKMDHSFDSETDTEILIHLIEEYQESQGLTIEEAVRVSLEKVIGAYAIVVMDSKEPDKIICAKKSSPLVIGIGDNEFFLASDATPIVSHTKKVVYLNDDEIATVRRNGEFSLKTIGNQIQDPIIEEIDLKIEELEKGGFEHFMLKEIYQQPRTMAESMRGRVEAKEGRVRLGGLEENAEVMSNAKRLIIAACGTSWHAGLIGEYLIEELAGIPVEVEYASELRYRNAIINEGDVVIALSQSGETADTLAAIEVVKNKGAFIYGIVNAVGSSISRETHAGSYIHAGPEIGVASTKAFTGQLCLLVMMALCLGKRRNHLDDDYYKLLSRELSLIPAKVQKVLDQSEHIKQIAGEIRNAHNALYLGRGYNFPVALEGALKMKEISYIHAEGYPAAEMKHGPIALIDIYMPVIVIATNKSAYEKIVSNIHEVKARKGTVIAIVSEGDEIISRIADFSIEIPNTEEPLTPLLSVIPLQLLSYYVAVMRGCDVDQPRNLAKSVTVE